MYEIQKRIKQHVDKAARKYKTTPWEVTSSQFWNTVSNDDSAADLTEWEIRKRGGLKNILNLIYGKPKSTPKITKVKFSLKQKKITNFKVHHSDIGAMFKKAKLKKNEIFKMVVQPDTHCPDHDPDAMSVFMKFLDDYRPHGLINLGDFLEMESVSHWRPNNPKPKRIVPELKIGRKLLNEITDAAGPQCKYRKFLEGNHEDWLQQYLNEKIPEVLDGLDELDINLDLKNLLGLNRLGYDFIPLNEILGVGEAHFIHGYYTGKHHASKHLDVFGVNIYYGHVHDIQGHTGVSVKGLHEAMSLGCLRTLKADFLKGKPNNWGHSLSVFEFQSNGTYTRYSPIVVGGKFSFNGKLYTA